MAIDTFIRCTIDPSASVKPDRFDHNHLITRAASAGGDLTLSFDKAKFTFNSLRSALSAALKALGGGNELSS